MIFESKWQDSVVFSLRWKRWFKLGLFRKLGWSSVYSLKLHWWPENHFSWVFFRVRFEFYVFSRNFHKENDSIQKNTHEKWFSGHQCNFRQYTLGQPNFLKRPSLNHRFHRREKKEYCHFSNRFSLEIHLRYHKIPLVRITDLHHPTQ